MEGDYGLLLSIKGYCGGSRDCAGQLSISGGGRAILTKGKFRNQGRVVDYKVSLEEKQFGGMWEINDY
jgi:hypothetical protein